MSNASEADDPKALCRSLARSRAVLDFPWASSWRMLVSSAPVVGLSGAQRACPPVVSFGCTRASLPSGRGGGIDIIIHPRRFVTFPSEDKEFLTLRRRGAEKLDERK